jgi:hypothetical protein
MRILAVVLVVLVLGMGYTTYVAWHKGQTHAAVLEASEDELNGLRKEKVRLVDENGRLKTSNTTMKAQLAESVATIEHLRNMPFMTPPQPGLLLKKK